MSQKTVIHTYCDSCLKEIKDDMIAHYEITWGKKTYSLDLCPACDEAFSGAWKPKTVPAPAKQKAPARKGVVKCDECDRGFVNDHGLRVHKARSHKK
jgi:hypothetical protein